MTFNEFAHRCTHCSENDGGKLHAAIEHVRCHKKLKEYFCNLLIFLDFYGLKEKYALIRCLHLQLVFYTYCGTNFEDAVAIDNISTYTSITTSITPTTTESTTTPETTTIPGLTYIDAYFQSQKSIRNEIHGNPADWSRRRAE